jgi:hypothetical protein
MPAAQSYLQYGFTVQQQQHQLQQQWALPTNENTPDLFSQAGKQLGTAAAAATCGAFACPCAIIAISLELQQPQQHQQTCIDETAQDRYLFAAGGSVNDASITHRQLSALHYVVRL